MLQGLLILADVDPPTFGLWAQGEFANFLFTAITVAFIYYMISRARGGLPIPNIRTMPALEAIDEAVGRATEMGRPVHYSPGTRRVHEASTLSSFAVLGYVAKLCAAYDTQLIQTNRRYIVHAVNQELIRQSYLEAGRPDAYNDDDVRYISGFQWAYTAGVIGIFEREKPAANIMLGGFAAECMILLERASMVGAITVGGTDRTSQIPFFMAAADYALIGEEIFAASAYISKEPVLRGSVVGQDIMRIIFLVLIVIGTIMQTINPDDNPLARFMQL